ncbi:MAG: hypothetical protein U5J98_00635 [Halobacteriales archaeon]|nr:hypothetical protein [Halobacteriales archaeon]
MTTGHDVRPDGGRGEVDREQPELLVERGLGGVDLRARGLEDEVELVGVLADAVGALGRDGYAGRLGGLEPVGLLDGEDADHPLEVDALPAVEELVHQIGPDVPGPDDGRVDGHTRRWPRGGLTPRWPRRRLPEGGRPAREER